MGIYSLLVTYYSLLQNHRAFTAVRMSKAKVRSVLQIKKTLEWYSRLLTEVGERDRIFPLTFPKHIAKVTFAICLVNTNSLLLMIVSAQSSIYIEGCTCDVVGIRRG